MTGNLPRHNRRVTADPNRNVSIFQGLRDVGTGFSETERHALQTRLQALETPNHPFAATPPRQDVVRARWVRPVLVGEVRYRQFTRGAGRLRHTSWRGLRADRDVAEVIAPRSSLSDTPPAQAPVAVPGQRTTVKVEHRQLTLSNLDKVPYPASGFTKAEVINYYSRVAPLMLPHLTGRPVTFIRFPDGVAGGQSSRRTSHGADSVGENSGSKGMQVYCPIQTQDPQAPSAYAKTLAQRLARETPDRVTATMTRAARPDRVFIDWSQNNPHKTTVAAYSLRGREHPSVSTPVTWAEVRACHHAEMLMFTAEDVLKRVDEMGDVLAGIVGTAAQLLSAAAGRSSRK